MSPKEFVCHVLRPASFVLCTMYCVLCTRLRWVELMKGQVKCLTDCIDILLALLALLAQNVFGQTLRMICWENWNLPCILWGRLGFIITSTHPPHQVGSAVHSLRFAFQLCSNCIFYICHFKYYSSRGKFCVWLPSPPIYMYIYVHMYMHTYIFGQQTEIFCYLFVHVSCEFSENKDSDWLIIALCISTSSTLLCIKQINKKQTSLKQWMSTILL